MTNLSRQMNVLCDVRAKNFPQVGGLLVSEESLWDQMEAPTLHINKEIVTSLSRALYQ